MTAVFLYNKSTTVMYFIGFYNFSFGVKPTFYSYNYL